MSAHNINHPLLAAQLEVWLNEKVDPDNPIFYGGQYTEIYGAIDPTIFEAALRQVLVEAEALRVKIYEDVNGPRQIIDDSLKWSMPFIDLSKEPDPKAAAEEWMKADLGRVVDLTHGPLFSFVLFKLGPEQFIWYQWTHHIVNDGFGYWLIARRVAEVYTSKANDLPGSDGVYSSLRLVIEDEERYLASEQFERDRLYWLECLAGMSEPTSLTDKPLVKSSSFLRETAYIQSVDADMMRMTAHRTGTTLSQLTIAAVAAYLSRLTDANEVILGLTVTARLGAVSRNAPCMMANVVPLRLITLPDMSVSELIQQVGQKTRQALRHQRYRSEYLKRELGLAATDRRLFGPTVNIMPFDYNLYFADHCATTHNLSNGMVEDLSIVVYGKSKDGEMRIDFNANPNLYTLGDLQNHLRRFLRFLEAVVADADQAVGQIDLLTHEERRQILKEWNETRVAFPQTQALHHLIEAQVERTPESVAVRFDDQSLTYAEMNRRSNQLAHFLRAMGVRPETLVGICLERSPETVVTIAGILKAGAAYLPLDPSYPSERLAFMLGDARPLVLLTQERLLRDLPKFGGETVCLDRDWQLIARQSEEDLRAFGSADNLAYVIYTSGSTGQPKGAMLTHAGILNCIYWMQGEYQLNFSDRFLVKTPLNFDPSVWELFWPLWVGGTLILAEPDRHQDPAYLAQLIAERDVTSAYFVPSMLRAFLDEPGLEVCRSLKRVICGGESLSIEAVNHFFERFDAEFHHSYGPTETSIAATEWTCRRESKHLIAPIGKPLGNIQVYILDAAMQPAPIGSPGELYIGGICVGRGYLNRPDLTAERFVPDPFGNDPGGRSYRTGDLARYLSGGDIEFCGRLDHQVKLRGQRIELGEVEAALRELPEVSQAVVVAREDRVGEKRLVGYVVSAAGHQIDAGAMRRQLAQHLPDYMVPAAIVVLEALPLTSNGKLDRRALPEPEYRPVLWRAPRTREEEILCTLFAELLGVERVGLDDNFFDMGANSIVMVQAASKLKDLIRRELQVHKMFQYPTISALAAYLSRGRTDESARQLNGDFRGEREDHIMARGQDERRMAAQVKDMADNADNNGSSIAHLKRPSNIAIIGMSGRFPQAPAIDIFWRNLCEAREAISFLSDAQLLAAGVDPGSLTDPRYVKAAVSIDGVDLFDASFFGFSPREAEILDPQHRLFLQTAWQALESAGYIPDRFPGLIGVFAGAGLNSYFLNLLNSNPELIATVGSYQTTIANDKDFLPTRISYKLNLRGPSIATQTGCSTSLVAVHLACQSLLNGECDMALAGGVSIVIPQGAGYLYQDGGIASSDGHCRAFDERASGTVAGSGLGIVVLKRLSEARADGDNILAVIKGSAVNNDGSGKVGYTAPSIDGQARVIAEAQAIASVDPETITYVETHGTGTVLGDPIEVAALTQAFRAATNRTGFCAIGSVKTNIGHLDAAAGVAGLIKTVLALKHRQIPASLHFERPNPHIDFANSPFYVNTELRPWQTNGTPRRAGVSSFGIGGTNAHLILEEAPAVERSEGVEGWQLLVLSARSDRSLTMMARQLAAYLKQHPELDLADVAFTLQEGRKAFAHRLSVVCRDLSEAITALEEGSGRRPYRAVAGAGATPVVYLFPGQGAQYVGMGRELYEQEPEYRSVIDRCAEVVAEESGLDLRRALYPGPEEEAAAVETINQTSMTQVLLFAVELGLARMWQSKGVQPEAMIGHSLGEYVAACLAGVMSEKQAIRLVAKRGVLMQRARPGAMLAVSCSERDLSEELREAGSHLEVAAINGPQQCVVSGEEGEIAEFEQRLNRVGIASKRLKTSHAFHSRMMEEVVGEYEKEVGEVELKRPEIRYVSNVSGKWISAQEARDCGYWGRQMRAPVKYWEGLEQIGREIPERVLLEVGPGRALSQFGRQMSGVGNQGEVATLGSEAEGGSRAVMEAVGKMWAHGVEIEWERWRKGKRRRVELPGYAFEEERYWVEGVRERAEAGLIKRNEDVGDWFYVPAWREMAVVTPGREEKEARRWLILEDEEGIGEQIAVELERQGCVVARVKRAGRYERRGEHEYRIRVGEAGDYQAVLRELKERGEWPEKIVHLFSLTREEGKKAQGWEDQIKKAQEAGFYSLVYLAQGIGHSVGAGEMEVVVVSNGVAEVVGEEEVRAEKATVMGPVKVMRQEYPHVKCRYIDVVIPTPSSWQEERLIKRLIGDLSANSTHQVVAYRGNHRWVQTYEAVRHAPAPVGEGLRPGGVYLITGGLGGVGMALAEYLAHSVKARLALTGRQGLPERREWDRLVEQAKTDEELRRRIGKIKELEEAGAEVEVIKADVSDEEEMTEALRITQRRFGRINGVIHAAGITGEQSVTPIQEITPAQCGPLFRPKVHGLFVLERVFRGADLDFCLLLSSISSALGGLGFAAYSGSNIFMDTFVCGRNRTSPVPWISVNWDGWRLKQKDYQQRAGFDAAQAELVIEPQEGVDAFQRIISMKMAGQVIVSTGDLQSRIRKWIDLESLRNEQLQSRPDSISGHSRRELQTAYVAPRNDLERSIAAIWQNLLGIEQIGVNDDFFDLGGHSLLVIQCFSRLQKIYKVEIPIRALFEKTTIAEYGEIVEEALIKEIETLTEEEVSCLRKMRVS